MDYITHNYVSTRQQTPVCARGSVADSLDLYRAALALELKLLTAVLKVPS